VIADTMGGRLPSGRPDAQPVVRSVEGEYRWYRECPECHALVQEDDVTSIINYVRHWVERHEGEESDMSTITEREGGKALPRYATSALNKAGAKAADLTDEQRERAMSDTSLRGKALASFVLTGEVPEVPEPSLSERHAESEEKDREAAKAAPKRRSRKTSEGDGETRERKPGVFAERYGPVIMERVARGKAEGLFGGAHTGPKDHLRVEEAARSVLESRGLSVTAENVAALVDDNGVPDAEVRKAAKFPRARVAQSIRLWAGQLADAS